MLGFKEFFLSYEPLAALSSITVLTCLSLLIAFLSNIDLKKNLFLAICIGYLQIIAATNLAFFIMREIEIAFIFFGFIALIFLLIIIIVSREIFADFGQSIVEPNTDNNTISHSIYCFFVLLIFCIVCYAHFLEPNPSAGFDFFHVWIPEYASASAQFGYFLTENKMNLGNGLLSSGGLYYQPNLFGVVALAPLLGWESELYPAYLGAGALADFLTIAVLAEGHKKRLIILFFFVLMYLLFLRYGPIHSIMLLNTGFDHILPLCGSIIMTIIARSEVTERTALQIVFVAGFMVFGRHYGAFYSAMLFVFLSGWVYVKFNSVIWYKWFLVGLLFVVFNFRDTIQVINNGLYFPRSSNPASLSALSNWDITNTIINSMKTWGLIPNPYLFNFPNLEIQIPYILFFIIFITIIFFLKKVSGDAAINFRLCLKPVYLLLLPFALELITGYHRSGGYPKTYLIVLMLYPWLPVYFASESNVDIVIRNWWIKRRPSIKILGILGVFSFGIFVGVKFLSTNLYSLGVGTYLKYALDSYSNNNPEYIISEKIKKKYPPKDLVKITQRPILYFYYEPGIGIRYFLEGNMFNDLDFYSKEVQGILEDSENFEQALKKMGYPSLFFSYGSKLLLTDRINEKSWEKFEMDFRDIYKKPYIKDVFRHGTGKLFILDVKMLDALS